MQWFRMYAEAVDDDKLRLLAFEDRWHYVAVLCLKSGGVLDSDPATLERRVAVKLGLLPHDLGEVKRRLQEAGLIDGHWQPLAWGKRQYSSDSSAERTRRWRVKRHGDVTVTDQNRYRTEQNRTELDARAPRSPACRLPEDFSLNPEREQYAKAQGIDPKRTLEEFRDYWRAASGQNARKHDWDATWRTWCRRAADGQKPHQKADPYARRFNPIN